MKNRIFRTTFIVNVLAMFLCVLFTFYLTSCTKAPSVKTLEIDCLKEFNISLGENLESINTKYPDIKAEKSTKGLLTGFYIYGDGNLEMENTGSSYDYVLNTIIKMTFDEESKLETFKIIFGCIDCFFKVKENYVNAIETLQKNGVDCLHEFNLPDSINNPYSKTINSDGYRKKLDISIEDFSTLALTWEMNK